MATRTAKRQKRSNAIPTRRSRRTASEAGDEDERSNAVKPPPSSHEYARELLELGYLDQGDEPEPSREMLNYINSIGISPDANTTARAKSPVERDEGNAMDSPVDDGADEEVEDQHLVKLEVPLQSSPKTLVLDDDQEDKGMADGIDDGNSERSHNSSRDLGYETAAYETAAEYETAGDVYNVPHSKDKEPNNEEPNNEERISDGAPPHIIGGPADLGVSWSDQEAALQASIVRAELNGAARDNHLGDISEEDTRRAPPEQHIRTPRPDRSDSGPDNLRSNHEPLTPHSEAQSQEEPDNSLLAINHAGMASTCTKLVSTIYVQQMIRIMPKDAWTQVKSNWQATVIKASPSSGVARALMSAMRRVWSQLHKMPSVESREAHVRYFEQNRRSMGKILAEVSRRIEDMVIVISDGNHAERGRVWAALTRCLIPMLVCLLEMVMETGSSENDDQTGRRTLPVSGRSRLSLFGLSLATRLNGWLLKLATAVDGAAKRDIAMQNSVRKDRGRILGLAKSLQQQLAQDTAELEELAARPAKVQQAKERDARIRALRAESMQRYEESRRSRWQRFCDASHRERPQSPPKSSQSVQQDSERELVSSVNEQRTRREAPPALGDFPEAVPERPAGLGETREWLMEDCERLLTIIRDGEKVNYPVIARQMGRRIEDVAFQIENIKYAVRKSMFQTGQLVPPWAIAGVE